LTGNGGGIGRDECGNGTTAIDVIQILSLESTELPARVRHEPLATGAAGGGRPFFLPLTLH